MEYIRNTRGTIIIKNFNSNGTDRKFMIRVESPNRILLSISLTDFLIEKSSDILRYCPDRRAVFPSFQMMDQVLSEIINSSYLTLP